MDGSWVLKPGERHASPTSCSANPALSLEVSGAEGLAESAPPDMLWFEVRFSRLGRCLGVGSSGEPGSFLTTTFGIWGVRSLFRGDKSVSAAQKGWERSRCGGPIGSREKAITTYREFGERLLPPSPDAVRLIWGSFMVVVGGLLLAGFEEGLAVGVPDCIVLPEEGAMVA